MALDNLRIGILAGGASRRMGRDKSQLLYNGRTFLEVLVSSARATGYGVVVIGASNPVELQQQEHPGKSLLRTEATEGSLEFIPDRQQFQGPLSALEAGLTHTSRPLLLLPCDVPLLQSNSMIWLIKSWHSRKLSNQNPQDNHTHPSIQTSSQLQQNTPPILFPLSERGPGGVSLISDENRSCRGLIARSQHRAEPLFAIYSHELLKDIRRLLHDGVRSLQSLLDLPGVETIDLPEWVAAQLLNVNTPDDYQALQTPPISIISN